MKLLDSEVKMCHSSTSVYYIQHHTLCNYMLFPFLRFQRKFCLQNPTSELSSPYSIRHQNYRQYLTWVSWYFVCHWKSYTLTN